MEQGKFKLQYDKDIMYAFHRIKKKIGQNNSVSFVIKRDKKGHGDIAVATLLSLYGFKDSTSPVAVVSKSPYSEAYAQKYKSKIFN